MTLLSELSENVESLVRETSPSHVAVEPARGQGSGIVVAQDGYVVTNSHVNSCSRSATHFGSSDR